MSAPRPSSTLAALLLAAWLGAAAPAPPTPAVAAARAELVRALTAELAIDDPCRRAWAAFEIGARSLVERRAALLPLARVAPPEVVAAAAGGRWTLDQALILAAREPERHRATLEALLA